MVKHQDHIYLDAIRDGNQELLKELYQTYLPKIERYILSNNGNKADAEDILGDALEAILRKLNQGNLVLTCSFYTFLFEICKRQWLKRIRKDKRSQSVTNSDLEVFKEIDDFEKFMEETERKKLLRACFSKLGELCQQILSLSWFEDKSTLELAEILNLSHGNFRQRKHRCEKKLEELIKRNI